MYTILYVLFVFFYGEKKQGRKHYRNDCLHPFQDSLPPPEWNSITDEKKKGHKASEYMFSYRETASKPEPNATMRLVL